MITLTNLLFFLIVYPEKAKLIPAIPLFGCLYNAFQRTIVFRFVKQSCKFCYSFGRKQLCYQIFRKFLLLDEFF